jgi:hypothetical protein
MAKRARRAKLTLTRNELSQVILGLAEYESSGQREKDEYTYVEVSNLRARLKRLANERFGENWAILEDEDEEEDYGESD